LKCFKCRWKEVTISDNLIEQEQTNKKKNKQTRRTNIQKNKPAKEQTSKRTNKQTVKGSRFFAPAETQSSSWQLSSARMQVALLLPVFVARQRDAGCRCRRSATMCLCHLVLFSRSLLSHHLVRFVAVTVHFLLVRP
jgi:hypothetical protein